MFCPYLVSKFIDDIHNDLTFLLYLLQDLVVHSQLKEVVIVMPTVNISAGMKGLYRNTALFECTLCFFF